MNTRKKNKICVISLTYNRSEYIERSFKSLYERAGCNFDLYVFDDFSDNKTIQVLKRLKKKYKFNLYINKERKNIYKNFYANFKKIPLDYDYYLKFDSDVEILTDNLFPMMIENFQFSKEIKGLTVRVEGIRNIDKYDTEINFYGGHAIKFDAPIIYGCCLMFSNEVFLTFKRYNEEELKKINEKWAIDTMIYDTVLKLGKFLIIEDLSVYHIDNTYGQRRVNDSYFIDRKRWGRIDNDEVLYMKISKIIYPEYIQRNQYEKIKNNSMNCNEFLDNCKNFLKGKYNEKIEQKVESKKIIEKKEILFIKKMYKITSPLNFKTDEHLEHGSFKYFKEIPDWAKNNSCIVIEQENIKVEATEKTIEESINKEEKQKKTEKLHKCKYCDYSVKSIKILKKHYLSNHPEKSYSKKIKMKQDKKKNK